MGSEMTGRERWAAKMLGQWRTTAKEALNRGIIVVKFLCALHITSNYICTPTLVYGPSMLPTLNMRGDVLLAERMSHRMGKVGLGDIVLVKSPENPKKTVTKRVLGMEGDRVSFLRRPYNSDVYENVVIPKGHVWLQGDNVFASKDSREFGPVPYGLIQGKAFCRVWPLDEFGPLPQ